MSYHYTKQLHKPRNVNEVHAESLSFNDQIALFVSRRVGTMWFCYGLALLMIGWALVQWALGNTAPDRYPYPFLFFCLGGIMQSLLMPLIMVAQNQQAKHAELRAEEQYKFVVKSYDDAEQIKSLVAEVSGKADQVEAQVNVLLESQRTQPIPVRRTRTGKKKEALSSES